MRVEIFSASGILQKTLFQAEILSFTKEMGRHAGIFRVAKNVKESEGLNRMQRVRFAIQKSVSEYGYVFCGVIDEVSDNGNFLEIGCKGMFFPLEKRIKSRSGTVNAGSAMFSLLSACNADFATGILAGVNTCTADTSIESSGKVADIFEDIGNVCEYDIDTNFYLNVADRLGEDKDIRLHYSENFSSQNTILSFSTKKDSDSIANKIFLKNNGGLSSTASVADFSDYGLCEEQISTSLVYSQGDLDALALEILELKKEGINEVSIVVKNKEMIDGLAIGLSVFDVNLGDSIEFAINSRDFNFSGRRRITKIAWSGKGRRQELELTFSLFGTKLKRSGAENLEKRLAKIEREIF